MKIKLDFWDESNEIAFFFEAEDVKDAVNILKITGSMMGDNAGYSSWIEDKIKVWISIKTQKAPQYYLDSGSKK